MIRSGLYPQLGKYFKTTEELAGAGCMSVRRLYDVLHGRKQFTEDEKRAIWNAILVKQNKLEVSGDFDERFKRKAEMHESNSNGIERGQ